MKGLPTSGPVLVDSDVLIDIFEEDPRWRNCRSSPAIRAAIGSTSRNSD